MTYCSHIETIVDDQGRMCAVCGVDLPEHWDCDDCEFVDVTTLGEPTGLRMIPGQPCVLHTDWRPTR